VLSHERFRILERKLDRERLKNEILLRIPCSPNSPLRKRLEETAKLRGEYSVHLLCEAMRMPRGTFYNHIFRSKGENSWFKERDNRLKPEIRRVFNEHSQILAAAKIAALLRQNGTHVTDKKVRALMHDMGLKSIRGGSKAIYMKQHPRHPNRVKGNFMPAAPNMIWASDVTEFWFKEHKYYICAIVDLYSRMAVAQRTSMRNSAHLVLMTLRAACKARNPPAEIIFHSDRGGPYTSMSVRRFCREHSIQVSYSRPGTPTDNAVMESFFSSLKQEKLYRCECRSVHAFRTAVADYFEYYNTRRPHQSLAFKTPAARDAAFAGGSKVRPFSTIMNGNSNDMQTAAGE